MRFALKRVIFFLFFLVSILSTVCAFAQIPTDDVTRESNPEPSEEKLISMRFKEAELDHVLDFLADATGYTIIKDAALSLRVTVISPHDIPIDEAFDVLNSILAMKGYTSIVNGKTVKIVALPEAKTNPIPTIVGVDPEGIKATDTIVTQIMKLSYADASQVAKDLAKLVPTYGLVVAHARNNSLIVTASQSNIKRLAEIIEQLDIPISELLKVEVFQLQYADATNLATVISRLFEKPRDESSAREQARTFRQRFGGRFGGRRGEGEGGGPGGPQEVQTVQTTDTPGEGVLQILGEVKVVAERSTNTLIAYASEQNLKIIRELVEKLDKQLFSEPETRVFNLKYADANDVADELSTAFSSRARSTFGFGTTGRGRSGRSSGGFFGQRFGPQQSQQTSETGGVLGLPELVAVADERTNSVMVTTTAQQMEAIGRLIEQLDKDIADYAEDTRLFVLEHADADNVASVLNNLFSTQLFERQRGARSTRSTAGGAMGTAARSAEEASGLTGNIKVVADETTNAILVSTFARNFPSIEKIIKQLDVLLPQVLIEAQIIEITLDDESVFGVEWMWEKEKTTVNGKDYSQTAAPDFGLSDEIFGLKYGIMSDNLDALLHVLAKNTKVNILSTPRIMTQNNQQAVINVGTEVPFLESTQETATGALITQYDFRDVGVILTVTPRINKSGTVSLDVNQEINSLIEFTLFNAPVIAKREATAYVTVKDGQTMIIGGIIKDDKTETTHKTPILGDIPLLGRLFQRKDQRAEKTELMVFITPHVVYTDEDANRVTEEQKSKLNLQHPTRRR